MNSQIFFSSLGLFLATPFLVIGGFQFSYQSTRIVTFSVAIAGMLGATMWRMREDENFRKKIASAFLHPSVLVYGLFASWLFLRTIPVFLSESWWGTWFRFDGIFFECTFVAVLVAIAAWASEFEFDLVQKKILFVLGFVLFCSLIIFPVFSLDKYVNILPEGRFSGSVGNPLYLAGLLLFVPWFTSRLNNKNLTLGATAISVVFLYLTDTRGAFIAALAGGAIFLIERSKLSGRAKIILATVGIVALGLGAAVLITGKIDIDRSITIKTRVAMWKSGLQEIMQQPLIGFGVGEHRNNIDRSSAQLSEVLYGEITDSTHSAYLDIALKGGLIALAIYFVWFVVLYRSILGSESPIGRATLVAYFVLIASSPWMVWTALPLAFFVGTAIQSKKNDSKLIYVFIGLCFVVIISAATVFVTVVKSASYLADVSKSIESGYYVNLPTGTLATNKILPFTKDFMIELLRITVPTEKISFVPSVAVFIENRVVPAIIAVEKRKLHPDALHIAATWSSVYASSGLTSARGDWLQRSLSLQQRALQINPDRPVAVFQAADSLRELGRIAEAIQLLKFFAEKHPALPEAQFYYALMVDISGDTQRAFLLEQQIKKDFPDYNWKSLQEWFTDIEARGQKL